MEIQYYVFVKQWFCYLYVPDNNPSGLYDFDKNELRHKFHRILNGHMST